MNSTRLACAVAVFTHAGCNFSFAPGRPMKTLTLTLLLACACRGGNGPESCVSDCWTTKAPLPTARHHLAVGVVNGVLYAVGGYGGYYGPPLNVVEAYNPVSNAWATQAPMPTPRGYFGVGLVNGVLYAVGGYAGGAGAGDTVFSVLEGYDPITNTWMVKAPMPTPRANLAVGVVNGVLYAVGGEQPDAYVYNLVAANEAYQP